MKNNSPQLNLHPERGSALLIAVVLFVGIASVVTFGLSTLIMNDIATVASFERYTASTLTAESGVEDAVYRLVEGMIIADTTTLSLNEVTATTSIDDNSGIIDIRSNGPYINVTGTSFAQLVEGTGAAFHYGIQAGDGGIEMKNTSSVVGNLYSNGPILGSGSNVIAGTAISGDSDGLIDGVHVDGDAYAHTIRDSDVDGDAYYQVIDNTDVGGTEYPGSEDQGTTTLPISDETIEQWKADAEAGGVYSGSCPFQINNNITLGPIKIPCDLQVQGSATIILAGAIWVEGDIDVQNSATMRVSALQDGKSMAIIADDPANPTTRGVISLKNNTFYEGAGDNSYILLISQNRSAEQGGGTQAITVQNSAEGDLLIYAGHGLVHLQNSVSLKEVTAHTIGLQNSAEVIYESGLTNLLFSSGPGGGYTIKEWGR